MLTKMLEELRSWAEEAFLPSGAFVRMDRGEALWVTDAPRRGVKAPNALREVFEIAEKDGLIYLTPKLASVPCRLQKTVLGLLKADAKEREKRIRQTLAACLREKNEEEIAFMKKLFEEEIS